MWEANKIIEQIKQHDKLNIALFSSNKEYQLTQEMVKALLQPHRVHYFFLIFLETGETIQSIDFKKNKISSSELFIIYPRQIYAPTIVDEKTKHYKLVFDTTVSTLLPQSFTFLLNPFNKQLLSFNQATCNRITYLFKSLEFLLQDDEYKRDTHLILSYLNSLMVELSHCYYASSTTNYQMDSQLQQFIAFKQLVEETFKEQNSLTSIAGKLGISVNRLNALVKHYLEKSSKQYITERILLEAKRILFYENMPVKELAYQLGFNDPDYFSRLFKSQTGLNIIEFKKSIHNLSSN